MRFGVPQCFAAPQTFELIVELRLGLLACTGALFWMRPKLFTVKIFECRGYGGDHRGRAR